MPILNRIAEFHDEMTAWRRDFHAHPEIAFEEHRTSATVAAKLEEWGIEVHRGIAGTGVVGVLHGAGGPTGRSIGLRADMDALPMEEGNGFAHRSTVPGKMHGCGHDGHTTMLLGAAKYLAETRRFDGTVHFIFQPAEEGAGGGKRMVEEGLFRRFPCDMVFGLHNWPELEPGRMAVRSGPVMAGADKFEITVTGHGGHAALPHHTVDPVVVAAQMVLAIQTLVSRNVSPTEAGVVSVTQIQAGSAFNVIPGEVVLRGTVRALTNEVRTLLESGLRRIVDTLPAAFGAEASLNYIAGYPPTINAADPSELSAAVAATLLGTERVLRDVGPSMGAEDFAFMLNERPGSYAWIGQGGSALGCMLHNARYDFNDEILPIGASYWALLVETALPREDARAAAE
ncbi:M20 aminoacylase family protein [Rhodospirillum centenum]|uniref:Peptidase M20D, amidohydrolase, putative n=1 Tax=Rhodospirillum centenum (strain ATCC 51521 / SW) TaxID=414684 RepID=B6ISJ0_RHOCS|nr:M20 aminoacylase family protein [Rhodospirillum centenum]ACI98426.1 peptidase M20D, amidohydrolase, putative [Rhodospirillum centenum SW]